MHAGEQATREEDLPFSLSTIPLEVRDFIHWNRRSFDEDFLQQVDNADALIIGGFSLLQFWRTDTQSGTYLEFAPDFLSRIKRPILFHGIGCDATRGVEDIAINRMRQFLDSVLGMDNQHFSLRNDGTIDFVRTYLGASYADAMTVIPDGGLFANPQANSHHLLPRNARFIAVNLAGDMPDKRYRNKKNRDIDSDFARHLADELEEILSQNHDMYCVFIPHIYSDFSLIMKVMACFSDRFRRTRVVVAPYVQAPLHWEQNFDLYRRAELVIAMRYHANLTSLGFGSNTLALSTHHKIQGQFSAYALQDRCFFLDEKGTCHNLFVAARKALQTPFDSTDIISIRQRERAILKDYHDDVADLLQHHLK